VRGRFAEGAVFYENFQLRRKGKGLYDTGAAMPKYVWPVRQRAGFAVNLLGADLTN
jgi:hypothetical protein